MNFLSRVSSLLVFIIILSIRFSSPAHSQENLASKLKVTDFELQSSVIVSETGEFISTGEFSSGEWYPVKVPTTVLSGLVKNGVYPDPYVGMNNMKIPDANPEFSQEYDLLKYSHLGKNKNPWEDSYWYRAEIELPENFNGRQIWLNFDGINYRTDVFLNGQQVANSKELVGMFEQFKLNVTDAANPGTVNYLAVKIYPLDYPGLPGEPQLKALGPFGMNGGPTGDIGKNVTMQSSVGWDWMPAVRDRNMGIWQDVYFSTTGSVDIRYPHVITNLPLPDTTSADLTIISEVYNTTDQTTSGELVVNITPKNFEGEGFEIRKSISINPNSTEEISLNSDEYPELNVQNPVLWWPQPYGKPNLYTMTLSFEENGSISDEESYNLGIREIDSKVTFVDDWQRRDFYVNGQRIQILGGAWVPDMMLNRDTEKLYNELKLNKSANFNMVRIWGGGVTPPREFFDFCDELGLLVWHDFWITGDAQGTFGKGTRDWPLEGDVFLSNARNAVKRLRHHPSLLVWTAGNEGYPRRELYEALRNDLMADMDGTRPFLPTSGYANPDPSWGLSWPDNHESGAYSGGPYHYVDPVNYYELVENGEDWVFKDEVGIPSVPPYENLQKFIPNLDSVNEEMFPLNNTWGYHDAAEGNGRYSLYHNAIHDRYGQSKTVKEYSQKGQFVSAENYRAIFEATNSKLNDTGGVILWKTNPAWPSVIWQVYDYYLRQNAGFYYAKAASEPPHVQLSLDDYTVSLVNLPNRKMENLTVHTEIYDENLQVLNTSDQHFKAEPSSSMEISQLDIPFPDSSSVRFVKLEVTNSMDEQVTENFYWLSPANNFHFVNDLPEIDLDVSTDLKENEDSFDVTVTMENPSQSLAFFVNPRLVDSDKAELLPTFWSDNYFVLLPGESKMIQANIDKKYVPADKPQLLMTGWNIKEKMIDF